MKWQEREKGMRQEKGELVNQEEGRQESQLGGKGEKDGKWEGRSR